ncbi:hypothetical protein [Billgrantia endophytica]|uniref:hypothetical protein n=1 Tax=Billgrantia endophytica TaxID=2033802 RepID=UPI001055EB55|nr:hypothetical protein [Halomonas endophytica]
MELLLASKGGHVGMAIVLVAPASASFHGPALLLLARALSRLAALLLLLARVTAGCCFSYTGILHGTCHVDYWTRKTDSYGESPSAAC